MYGLFDKDFIFKLIAIVVGLVVHEFAHAWSASILGDKTAKMQGRVTLNPVAHLDPIGLLMILFAPVGWAKPVPVNSANFRRPRLDSSIVALAGPVSNLLLAIICVLALRPYLVSFQTTGVLPDSFLSNLLQWGFFVNGALFVFNLIPVPPLDGSRVVSQWIPYRWDRLYRRFELYGPFILLLLFIVPQVQYAVFHPLFQGVESILLKWFGPSV